MPLAGETLEPGSSRGISNVFAQAEARVSLEHGVLLAIRPGTPAVKRLAALVLAGSRRRLRRRMRPASRREVVLVTHDSFVVSKPVRAAFERESGLRLRILQSGDAGAALNRALLTKGNPEGDVFFGVDNNLLSRALGEDLFEPYEPAALDAVPDRYELDTEHRVTPIDHGEVCLNIDTGWFAERGCRRRARSTT